MAKKNRKKDGREKGSEIEARVEYDLAWYT